MGIFDSGNMNEQASKEWLADAIRLSTYAYHNLFNGLEQGYMQNGFHSGLPLTLLKTLFGSTSSQGVIPGIPWNPDSEQAALEKINQAGWDVISAEKLGYNGITDQRGTFYGETALYQSAQLEVLGKYDSAGNLSQIGLAFRGTSGPREILVSDTFGDIINDLLIAFGPEEFATNWVTNAFNNLLNKVVDFAKINGLSAENILITGHSLGGIAVNSMASQSQQEWGGFFANAHYLAFASPTQYEQQNKVLNVGFENDPVFRALDGIDFNLPVTLGVHDSPHSSSTDNIVSFNDYYASSLWNILPFSILNPACWLSHMLFFSENGLMRLLQSDFYSLTERDSTVIIGNLSDTARHSIWIEDLGLYAEKHSGPTFIIGSDHDDLIKGGVGNDYLDGGAGNDIFRDDGGYNIIHGGQGYNILDLQHSIESYQFAYDGETIYIRDNAGITIAKDIDTIRSSEPHLLILKKDVDHQVTAQGLISPEGITQWAPAIKGNAYNNELTATGYNDWLFGLDGDDILTGHYRGAITFVAGAGNDIIYSKGDNNTFLFSGDFGNDKIYGYNNSDTLIFMGVKDTLQGNNNKSITKIGDDLVLNFGKNSITLVGIDQHDVMLNNLIFA